MKDILKHKLVLKEAAVVEQLRRSSDVQLHPSLVNAPLIYDELGAQALKDLYQAYLKVAQKAKVPFLMSSPTWRANAERVKAAKVADTINKDAIKFMQQIREEQSSGQDLIKIGGLIGCKNDCYKPEEGLSEKEAEEFHSWQINELASAGADFLVCETIPLVSEAKGIAKAMEKTGLPYFISFVISRDGLILDGTKLIDAIQEVDGFVNRKPLGYQINCAYPSFLCADTQPPELFERLIAYQANGSALDHCDLDGADDLAMEAVSDWAEHMRRLNQKYGMKILGGCCGTGVEHLEALVNQI